MSEGETRKIGVDIGVGHRFAKGNPGRPRGCRNRITVWAEKMMGDQIEDVIKSVVREALAGDMQAAKLILDRLVPVRRGETARFAMPKLTRAEDAVRALARIIDDVGAGVVASEEAAGVAALLEGYRRMSETASIEARLRALEERQNGDGDHSPVR